jgi:hypothetical protein
VQTVYHFWPAFLAWLKDLRDTRDQRFITYDRKFLLWWALLLFLLKLGSRRQLDFDLRDPESDVLENVNRLAGTHQQTLPVSKTLEHFLGHVGMSAIAALRTKMVARLIRSKALDDGRLQNRLLIAFDGTGWLVFDKRHCDHCLTQENDGRTLYYHLVEEAKMLGPSELALSVGSEFIENRDLPAHPSRSNLQKDKQDYELAAAERLASSIKHDFPRTPICILADSEFACGRGISMARDRGWSFVFSFKEGRTPALWREFQALLDLSPENRLTVPLPGGGHQVYRWLNGLPYEDSEHRSFVLNALECLETVGGKTTRFAWITDLPLGRDNVPEVATKGGRARWRIENQGFNIQKNSDLNLEHPYSTNSETLKSYYLLLQIAHMVLQLLEKGSLLKRLAAASNKTTLSLLGSLKNIARRLLEAFRNRLLPDSAFDPLKASTIQIRFSSA